MPAPQRSVRDEIDSMLGSASVTNKTCRGGAHFYLCRYKEVELQFGCYKPIVKVWSGSNDASTNVLLRSDKSPSISTERLVHA